MLLYEVFSKQSVKLPRKNNSKENMIVCITSNKGFREVVGVWAASLMLTQSLSSYL